MATMEDIKEQRGEGGQNISVSASNVKRKYSHGSDVKALKHGAKGTQKVWSDPSAHA